MSNNFEEEAVEVFLEAGSKNSYIPILKALRTAYTKGMERAAVICDDLPIDAARCRILLMTEQAWEEGQYACAEAIRSEAQKILMENTGGSK